MAWPPKVGEVLPRAAEAWCDRVKLEDWVLGAKGHGREGDHGVGCGVLVLVELAINARVAAVLSGWHYAHEEAAPRLVTAYPKPYTRGHGNRA